MIFLSTGSYPKPFDRLVRAVDRGITEGLIKDEIVAQIGYSRYIPRAMKYHQLMDKCEFDLLFKRADGIISHAGMGNISMAIAAGKPILVFPRLANYREVVNDHQLETARIFEELGHVLAAYTDEDLYAKIGSLRDFIPKKRLTTSGQVAQTVDEFLRSLLSADSSKRWSL